MPSSDAADQINTVHFGGAPAEQAADWPQMGDSGDRPVGTAWRSVFSRVRARLTGARRAALRRRRQLCCTRRGAYWRPSGAVVVCLVRFDRGASQAENVQRCQLKNGISVGRMAIASSSCKNLWPGCFKLHHLFCCRFIFFDAQGLIVGFRAR